MGGGSGAGMVQGTAPDPGPQEYGVEGCLGVGISNF